MIEITVTLIPLPDRWEVVVKCQDPQFELSSIKNSDPDAARFVGQCVDNLLALV